MIVGSVQNQELRKYISCKIGQPTFNVVEFWQKITNFGVAYTKAKERKNERTNERKNERTKERKNERTKERKNERTKERKNERTKERKNERTKERKKRRLKGDS
jgi:hypothetical protein